MTEGCRSATLKCDAYTYFHKQSKTQERQGVASIFEGAYIDVRNRKERSYNAVFRSGFFVLLRFWEQLLRQDPSSMQG